MKKAPSPITVKELTTNIDYTTLLKNLTQSLYNALLAVNLYAIIVGAYQIAIACAVHCVLSGAL